MKGLITTSLAAALLVGGQGSIRGEEPAPTKQLLISLKVLEGDPRGSPEAGTLKVLSAPNLVTTENRPFSLFAGGELAVPEVDPPVQFGMRFEGKPGTVKDGKVRLDATMSNITVGDRTDTRIQVHTTSLRTIATVRLGEVVKLHYGKTSPDKQMWVELLVEEAKP